ncbi:phage portal protein [Actinoplanes sp. NPDC049802]|uniref:phage portal protein n=1 Tax=Actinoplanes sp. NPDC049802 TaxID=3154742 RepID=UPI0034010E9B
MGIGDRLRAVFGMRTQTFDEPRAARFSAPYEPVNVLVEGLLRGMGRVGREDALGVPAVLRGRNMICSIATLPLEAVDADNRIQDHRLLRQIDPDTTNVAVLSMLVEDLLFEGVAWLRWTAFGWDGYPVNGVRYAPGQVSMNPPTGYDRARLPSGLPTEGVVWMAGVPVPFDQVCRFDSPNPPLLVAGQKAIRRAIALDAASELYARNPRRRGYFAPKEGADPADDEAILDALDAWHDAASKRVDGYVPYALDYQAIQDSTPAELQLVQMQQRASLDLANALGVDPEDLGVNTTSRTYQNATDRRQDRINEVLAPYMRAVCDRLSMPDVTKRGVTVRFSLRDYLKADPKTRAEVQAIYHGMGATDAAEVREDEGRPPRVIEKPQAPRQVESSVGEPVQEIEAAGTPVTFAREGLSFGYEVDAAFAVDQQARTITGLAVPWGKVARSGGKRYRFAKGSVRWSAVNRVKLLRDHQTGSAIGKAVRLEDTDQGLVATFQVSPGAAGDEALALAVDEVLDGLSIGVDFRDTDLSPDPQNPGAYLVTQAALREVSLTAVPAFDDSRLTSVTAAREEGSGMPEEIQTEETPAAPQPVTFSAEQFDALMGRLGTGPADRPTVDPTRTPPPVQVNEALPYRVRTVFNRVLGDSEFVFANEQEHNFAADLAEMARERDGEGRFTDAGKRVMGLLSATFADVDSTDVSHLNPAIQRPDMYVDQRDYRTPLMDLIGRGAPPNGIQPFTFPKFSSAAGLVADHTQGTEPASGSFVTTNQTVTPTAISGKASITREVWDMGGNPAVSGLIFNQMVRGYREGLESAAATFLNTLTAATDITLTTAGTDAVVVAGIETALADLQFTRGYDFRAFVLEAVLYKKLAGARDTSNRPYYPILSPMNANGTAASRFRTLDIAGVTGIPSWALASTAGAANNSWLFDPSTVFAWHTAPQRLEFPGSGQTAGSYSPVAYVDLAIWGYKAFANTDIGGVRQVIWDSVT